MKLNFLPDLDELGICFNIIIPSYQDRKSHCWDKVAVGLSYRRMALALPGREHLIYIYIYLMYAIIKSVHTKVNVEQKIWLTHLGQVMHTYMPIDHCVSDNGVLPGQRQAIIRTNARILLIGPLGTNFSEILSKIHIFSFKKMHLKMSSMKWQQFCLSLNVIKMSEILTFLLGFYHIHIKFS